MKYDKIIKENYKDIFTGKQVIKTYRRVKDRGNISPLYTMNGRFYTHGFLGWFDVTKYLK